MKALKTIVAIIPGPALVYVGQWINLLSSTVLAHPVWQVAADRFALGFGTILTLFVSIGWADAPKEVLKRRFYVGCGIVIVGVIICWVIWLNLGPPPPGAVAPNPTWWQGVWETVYVFTQSILVATISIGALSIREDKPWLFWFKAIIAVLLAVLVIYLIFFWHR